MLEHINAPFLFVIDTMDYAGNFERELCAYLTGRIGECEVGRGMADDFKEDTGREPFENVLDEADEHGCHRPVTIYPTPGFFNNGHGGHFEDLPENMAPALEAYKVHARKDLVDSYAHRNLSDWRASEKSRADYEKAGWTEQKLVEACAELEAKLADVEAMTAIPHKWPAYQSVAILFETEPTADQVALMKARAAQFAELPHRHGARRRISRIIGFRLVKRQVTVKEDSVEV